MLTRRWRCSLLPACFTPASIHCETVLLRCVAVKWCFQMAEERREKNKFTGCTLSVGCVLLQASMNHSKGGSENVCVKNDTSAALAPSCQGCCTFDMQLEFQLWHFSSCSVAVLSLHYIPGFFSCIISTECQESQKKKNLGPCCEDVRECMSVAPPTEWACVALWLIPPLSRSFCSEAWWNSTHKHTGLNTSCRLSIRAEVKRTMLVCVVSGCPFVFAPHADIKMSLL